MSNSTLSKTRVLVMLAVYLPGYKSGGPVRTIANMVDHLGDEFEFYIITNDRDVLDTKPYPSIKVDEWNSVGKATVYYTSPAKRSLGDLTRLIKQTPHDVLYLNSFYMPTYTLLPLLARRFGWLPEKPVVIAPRGEFSEGALALKRWKKVPYRLLTRIFGLYRNLIWQASSDYELRDIKKAMSGIAQRIHVASDLPPKQKMEHFENSALDKNAELRVCFLSRITPMKNLDYALRILSKIRIPVKFSIIGPARDETYWAKCQKVMESLPEHIEVSVVGSIEHAQVASMMESHDLFFLPTLGENYGHAIPEALAAGTPVLIADTTPWRGLYEAGVGWDLPLDDEQGFIDAIELTAKMSPREYAAWRTRIKEYAIEQLSNSEAINANRQLFIKATLK